MKKVCEQCGSELLFGYGIIHNSLLLCLKCLKDEGMITEPVEPVIKPTLRITNKTDWDAELKKLMESKP